MNIAKNMEVIFIAALALVSATTLAHATVPSQRSVPHIAMQAEMAAPMTVVTIVGKRLTAAQKAQLGA